MNAFIITRETGFSYDTKVVFDRRDLVEDKEACIKLAHELWPGDPKHTLPDIEDAIQYYAQPLPCDTIQPTIRIYMDYDMTTWLWETCWRTYDYKDNIVEGIFECGNSTDYGVASREAFTSYTAMVVMEDQNNG